MSCTTFNDTLRRNEAWWMAAGGSRLVAVPDGGQSVTAPRQATRCPLLPAGAGAGDTGMCNVSFIINYFSSDTLELLGLFLISIMCCSTDFSKGPVHVRHLVIYCCRSYNSILSPKRWFLVLTCVLRCGCGPVNCAIECVRRQAL